MFKSPLLYPETTYFEFCNDIFIQYIFLLLSLREPCARMFKRSNNLMTRTKEIEPIQHNLN